MWGMEFKWYHIPLLLIGAAVECVKMGMRKIKSRNK